MIENVPKGMFLITSNLLINVTRIFWQSFAFKNRKWGYNNKFGVLPDRIWRAIRFLQKCNYLLMWNLVKTKRKVARLIRSGTPKPKKVAHLIRDGAPLDPRISSSNSNSNCPLSTLPFSPIYLSVSSSNTYVFSALKF